MCSTTLSERAARAQRPVPERKDGGQRSPRDHGRKDGPALHPLARVSGMPRPTPAPRSPGDRCCEVDPRQGLQPDEAAELAEPFRLLSDPVRLQILDVLSRNEGQVCVCDLEAAVPVKQPTVSHHLGILRRAGLVESERRGVWAYYFLNRERLDGLRRTVEEYLGGVAGAP
jgi:ArsR family transcriptional regulator